MPVDRSDNQGVRPTRSPDGTFLGWLRVNFPDAYKAVVNNPGRRRLRDYRSEDEAKKHPSRSGRFP